MKDRHPTTTFLFLAALLICTSVVGCASDPLPRDKLANATPAELFRENDEAVKGLRTAKGYSSVWAYRAAVLDRALTFLSPQPTTLERGLIYDNRLAKGMTFDMVALAWGRPHRKTTVNTSLGPEEYWWYGTNGTDYDWREVYFFNGFVTFFQTVDSRH